MGLCFTKQTNEDSMNSTKGGGCCVYSDFERRVYPIIDNLNISPFKKNIIRKRYVKLVLNYETHYDVTHYRYNLCRILISVGSMMLPTLQTIQNNENVASIKDEIFWSAIGTSLTVMVCNNVISMFALDRRYIMYAVTAEKLKSIGWQYFEESGIFANSSHSLNYTKFWNEIEKTIKLQIMSEFSSDDKSHKDDDFDINDKYITSNIELKENTISSPNQKSPEQSEELYIEQSKLLEKYPEQSKLLEKYPEKSQEYKLNISEYQERQNDFEKFDIENQIAVPFNKENIVNNINNEIVLETLQKEIIEKKKE